MLDLLLYILIISSLSIATVFIMLSIVWCVAKVHDLVR